MNRLKFQISGIAFNEERQNGSAIFDAWPIMTEMTSRNHSRSSKVT